MLKLSNLTCFISTLLLVSCFSSKAPKKVVVVKEVVRPNFIYQKEVVPEGAEKYCWQEPLIQYDKEGPGVDPEGNWYSHEHAAAREVKSGYWRPCSPGAKSNK